MSVLMRRVQSRYAQYYNAHAGRNGHLWQNRFFGCMLAPSHLWTAIAYVELNPVRAKTVRRAEDYMWSSAIAHVTGGDGIAGSPSKRSLSHVRSLGSPMPLL